MTNPTKSSEGLIVLFLATELASGRTGQERRIVDEGLEEGDRARFELRDAHAVQAQDITRELMRTIGDAAGVLHLSSVVIGDTIGVESSGERQAVPAEALADAIKLATPNVNCVVLSRCWTETTARALVSNSVAVVVGTAPGTAEGAAERFLEGFYRGISFGTSVGHTVAFGDTQVGLLGLGGSVGVVMAADAIDVNAYSLMQPTKALAAAPLGDEPPPISSQTGQAWFVPRRNEAFTGRDHLLAALTEQLNSGNVVVTHTIHGMGGVGKTELAIEYAYRHQDEYDVAWRVAAEDPTAILGQLTALARELGLKGEQPPELLAQLNSWFAANDRWLLIVDNVEEWDEISAYLPQTGSGHILVTTRRHDVPGQQIRVDLFTPEEGTAFVEKRTRRTDEPSIAVLVETLGRLPLALEQACSYVIVSGTSVASYVELFEARAGELLGIGDPGRHRQTVTATYTLALEQAIRLCAGDEYCRDPESLATLLAFFAGDDVPVWVLSYVR